MPAEGSLTLVGAKQLESINVSSFHLCSCLRPAYTQPHLAISKKNVPLCTGNAVAISYAIGEFGRAKHVIGHSFDDADRPFRLELGGEWDISGMIDLLANITKDKSAIWMDQFSVEQQEDEIRKQLQRIPVIYSTLEVIVLLPNEPCTCLRDAFDQYEAGDESLRDSEGDFHFLKVFLRCRHSVAVSSFNFRIWTKQEFGYARAISARYCSRTGAECSKSFTGWAGQTPTFDQRKRYLNSYFTWLWKNCQAIACSYSDDPYEVRWSLIQDHLRKGWKSLFEYITNFHMKGEDWLAMDSLNRRHAEFLLGKQLVRKRSDAETFMFFGEQGHQKATVKKDYVLAVFPGIKRYQIPADWATMSLNELVDDAFSQYEFRTARHWVGLLPQGLFHLHWGSSRCRPSLYIDPVKVQDHNAVYGALHPSELLEINGVGSVMLRLFEHQRGTTYRSRILRSQTYKTAFGHKGTNEALNFMRRVTSVTHWWIGSVDPLFETWAAAAIKPDQPNLLEWPYPELGAAAFAEMLHNNNDWGTLPEIDHCDVCYKLLCGWAHIDPDIAREKGLGLVVAVDDPPCIGFVCRDLNNDLRRIEELHALRQAQGQTAVPPPDERNRRNHFFAEEWLSVHVDPYTEGGPRKDLVYELARVMTPGLCIPKAYWIGDEDVPEKKDALLPLYMVFGVWFETNTDDPSVGGQITRYWGERDAIMV